jgi:hypothetical protein
VHALLKLATLHPQYRYERNNKHSKLPLLNFYFRIALGITELQLDIIPVVFERGIGDRENPDKKLLAILQN